MMIFCVEHFRVRAATLLRQLSPRNSRWKLCELWLTRRLSKHCSIYFDGRVTRCGTLLGANVNQLDECIVCDILMYLNRTAFVRIIFF